MKAEAILPLSPEVTATSQGFWEGTKKGELRLLTCGACGTRRFPETPVCPKCLAEEATWEPVSGRGRLWSWIVMHQKAFPSYLDQIPYLVAFIELDEGHFMISTIVDPPADIQCDLPVQVEFLQLDDERSAPVFRVVR
jgi:uncharacterized OB-fold protein